MSFFALFVFAVFCLVNATQAGIIQNADKKCTSKECEELGDTIRKSVDSSIDPCQDFYGYTCGNYMKSHQPGKGYLDRNTAFDASVKITDRIKVCAVELADQDTARTSDNFEVNYLTADILEGTVYDNRVPTISKAKKMYRACIDAVDEIDDVRLVINNLVGPTSLLSVPEWDDDTMNQDAYTVVELFAILGRVDVWPLVKVEVNADLQNPSENILEIDVAKAAYLSEKDVKRWNSYRDYITSITQAVVPSLPIRYDDQREIMLFGSRISELIRSDLERLDPTKSYTKLSIAQLQGITDPQRKVIVWLKLLVQLTSDENLTEDDTIVVTDINYVKGLTKLLAEVDNKVITNYMAWKFLDYSAETTFGKLRDIEISYIINMTETNMSDVERSQSCVTEVEKYFGHLLSAVYITKYLPENAKKQVTALSSSIIQTFIKRLEKVDFMDNVTKEEAIEKARNMVQFIGYPDWILDDEKLTELYQFFPNMTESHFLNQLIMSKFYNLIFYSRLPHYSTARLRLIRSAFNATTGFPMLAIDVNAEYVMTSNSITVPAGILQMPFYQYGLPTSYNFGALGSVIGHEITHGFDNIGRKFNKFGELQEWWPESVTERFDQETSCFINQYKRYCLSMLDLTNKTKKYCVRSIFTLQENIADNGGLEAAYQAWKEQNSGKFGQQSGIENFTQEQLFYIGVTLPRCTAYTKLGFIYDMEHESHTSEWFRLNAALANSPGFADAFKCPVGQMNRGAERCVIW